MSANELNELDAFCAEFVMGWVKVDSRFKLPVGSYCVGISTSKKAVYARLSEMNECEFSPTTDPTDAMEVLKKCMEKCASRENGISIDLMSDGQTWVLNELDTECQIVNTASAETLELAICLFAKQLFGGGR